MFEKTYAEARERFRAAAVAAGVNERECSQHQHPLCGPGGEKLFVDVATWGSLEADRTLVLMSGTHGIEGFVGSAIQTALLEGRYGPRPHDLRILLVHALNPYGFAWYRRANESGVDLNRNFVDFTSLPPNPRFTRALANALVPAVWDGSEDAELGKWVTAHGIEGLKQIVPLGQYEHWFAPFYGGRVPEWSNAAFRTIVRAHLKDSRNIVFIDYHSGLGEHGTGQLIARSGAAGREADAGERLWGAAYVKPSDQATVAYAISGDTLTALHGMLPDGALLTCASHEFGTRPVLDVLKAVRFDHYLHTYGDLNLSRLIEQKALLREAFCPLDEVWERQVLDGAGHALASVLGPWA